VAFKGIVALVVCLALAVAAFGSFESALDELLTFESEEMSFPSEDQGIEKRAVSQSLTCDKYRHVCFKTVRNADGSYSGIVTITAYIEYSYRVTFPVHTNAILYGPDKKRATTWVLNMVLPARLPGGAPIDREIFKIKGAGGSWRFSSKVASRTGSYKAVPSGSYRLPFAGTRKVGQGYGGTFSHTGSSHYSIDFHMPQGTRVLAPRDGVVFLVIESNTKSKFDSGVCPKPVKTTCSTPGSDNNLVFIRYSDRTYGYLAHFRSQGVEVTAGQVVRAGQHIAFSGNTGWSTTAHLHISVFKTAPFSSTQPKTSVKVTYKTASGSVVTPASGGSYTGAPEL